jgi:23S rRNA (guanosine2251-2'-O)-methyltransferase
MHTYFISGIHSVAAALKNKKRFKKKLYITKENKVIESLASKNQVKCFFISQNQLKKIMQNDQINHQNLALEIGEKEILTIDKKKNYSEVFLCLNNINDMRNLGSIIRTAAAFSINNIILEKKINLSNNLIHRTSAGLIENINIFQTVNLKYAFNILKKQNYWITSLTSDAKESILDYKWPKKNIILFGSEGNGLNKLIEKNSDFKIKIPIDHKVESLNLSNAVAITMAFYKHNLLSK